MQNYRHVFQLQARPGVFYSLTYTTDQIQLWYKGMISLVIIKYAFTKFQNSFFFQQFLISLCINDHRIDTNPTVLGKMLYTSPKQENVHLWILCWIKVGNNLFPHQAMQLVDLGTNLKLKGYFLCFIFLLLLFNTKIIFLKEHSFPHYLSFWW